MTDTTEPDPLEDPLALAGLRALARNARTTRTLCPGCSRRELDDDADLCTPCTDERSRARKRDWWHEQGDYRALLARGLRPADAARRWLAHRLRKGPVDVATIRADADAAGIAPRTLQRARERLRDTGRLTVERAGLERGQARWRLTTTEERTTS